MSIFGKIKALKDIQPEINTKVDTHSFTLVVTTHIPGFGDYETVTDLEPLYDLFINQMIDDDWLKTK